MLIQSLISSSKKTHKTLVSLHLLHPQNKPQKMTSSSSSEHQPIKQKPIPGSYGLPFFGPIRDRYDYFYIQGRDEFFRSRMTKYNSTVFRANMPPGPFISGDSRVVVLLDALSFPILFDTSKVEKRNVLDGTFMPSLAFTGGIRTCAFLDPSETEHSVFKNLVLKFLASKHHQFIPLFQKSASEMFSKLEIELGNKKFPDLNPLSDAAAFDFIFRLLSGRSPDPKFSSTGPGFFNRWLMMQLAPLGTAGLPKYLSCFEDLIIHTFRLPFALVKRDYNKLFDEFYQSSPFGSFLDEAEKQGMDREKACHNLVFLAGFNAYAGMKVLLPIILNWVGSAGEGLHRKLAGEIRAAVDSGELTFSALEKMTLLKSVIYEVLRIDPPVPYQYAKAKQEIVIQNHDSAYKIKKGEMIFGYQPFATKDPKVFENPEVFVGDRFVGETGEKLLKYVYWSNGRETEAPTAANKQCPARDLVLLLSKVLLVELFLRYDTFAVDGSRSSLGWSVKVMSLTKSTAKAAA